MLQTLFKRLEKLNILNYTVNKNTIEFEKKLDKIIDADKLIRYQKIHLITEVYFY